LIYLLRNINS